LRKGGLGRMGDKWRGKKTSELGAAARLRWEYKTGDGGGGRKKKLTIKSTGLIGN